MLLSFVLYGLSIVLFIYIIVGIAQTREFKTGDKIATLGIIISIILAVSLSPAQTSNQPTATSLPIESPTIEVLSTKALATETQVAIPTNTPSNTVITSTKCSDNLLAEQWHLEATDDADEAWMDFSDQYILKDKNILRVTYNLHGLMAQMGDRKNDSVIVFNQPDWYGISLADPKYGVNGLDGEQTIDIPLSDFVELPNPDTEPPILGGKPLDLNAPVSSVRARFWHTGHFIVDITSISVCTSP